MKIVPIVDKEIRISELANLVVGLEHKAETVRFTLDKVYADETDLSQFTFYLQYKNRNGQGEPILLTKSVSGNVLNLDWQPTGAFTQVNGRCQIQVFGLRASGSETNRWSTQIPAGTNPVWGSTAMFSSTGDQVGDWTTPVRMSGIDSGAYRGTSTTDPADPIDKDYYLYTGATTESRTQYHYYKYSAINDSWAETTASYVVMAGLSDAMAIAQQTGDTIYAAAIFTDLLAAMHLVMTGSGIIEGGYSEDSNGKPLGGYKLSAMDGMIRAVGALLRNVTIQDGYADFGSLRIEPEASTGYPVTATSDNDQAKTIRDHVRSVNVSLDGKIVPCSIAGYSSYVYLKTYYYEWSSWGFGGNETYIYLYDSGLNLVATIERKWSSSSGITSSGVLSEDPEVTVYTGGNKMLVDLPISSLGLEQGRVWVDNGTLKVVQ